MCNSYNVRKLKASEIEIKPCQVAKDQSWVQVLLYKTSRVDMQILTEMYGSKWKSSYQMVGDSLFCTISVYDNELGEWISRTDCGEKDAGISEEKSYATSAFKRAATQFGIGIELYSTPKIKFPTNQNWFYNNKLTMTFELSSIEWDGDNLKELVIVDRFGNIVYNWSNNKTEHFENQPQQQQTLTTQTQYKLTKLQQPLTENGMLQKRLYLDVMKSTSTDRLKEIYDLYPELTNHKIFLDTLSKRKEELLKIAV